MVCDFVEQTDSAALLVDPLDVCNTSVRGPHAVALGYRCGEPRSRCAARALRVQTTRATCMALVPGRPAQRRRIGGVGVAVRDRVAWVLSAEFERGTACPGRTR